MACGFCEMWFHSKCVEGMTPEFLDCCDKMNRLYGGSAFLCVSCRKLAAKLNGSVKALEQRMTAIEERLKTVELERDALKQQVEKTDNKADQVKEGIGRIEKEIEEGMEKAKNEVKEEVGNEMKEREARSGNVVLYGIVEKEEEDVEKRKEAELGTVKEVARDIGVELKGEVKVKFRAGKREETRERPRPLIVTIEDKESREKLLNEARKLARSEKWKTVYVSRDLTWKQRDEARKEEQRLRELGERRTEEAKKEGRKGKYVVVGRRGSRRLVWFEEGREERSQ